MTPSMKNDQAPMSNKAPIPNGQGMGGHTRRARPPGRWGLILGHLLVIGAWSFAPSSAFGQASPATKPAVSSADQAVFQQKNAAAQMQELEGRMFKLAETIRQTEPSDSARLLLGVRKAREQLIVEQMKEVLEKIGQQKDLDKATEEQKQLIAKLEELKKLLLAGENDLILQLERLKKMESAIAKLEGLIKEQKRQEAQSGKLADQQKKSASPEASKFAEAKNQQAQNRQGSEAVAQQVRELGAAGNKAGTCLGSAGGSMSSAESQLQGQKAADAATQQSEAAKALEQAKKELEAERQKLLEEVEKQVRAQVIENLTQMLDRQKLVREQTEKLSAGLQSGDREAALRAKRLATAEKHIVGIADQTVELIELTQFSVALPPAIRGVQRQCLYVTADLEAGRGDAKVVAAEQQVERDLTDLIDTMKQAAAMASAGNSQCKGCKGNKNKLLAELKVLRLMQLRVNEETKDADGRRAAALAELPADLKAKIGTIRDNQGQAHDAADKIHRSVCPDCLAPEE
jgi:hypothetical protein